MSSSPPVPMKKPRWPLQLESVRLPTENDVGCCCKQTVLILEWSRFFVVSVAQLGSNDDSLAHLERQPAGDGRVQSLEAGALALEIIEKLQAGRAAQTAGELVGEVIDHAQPVGRANVRHVRRE